jgi:ribosome-binding protein aMBF1 (putative translation factor)
LSPAELAREIEEDLPILERIERGEVNADWATLRVIAAALALPLPALFELAEELAPGPGGAQWRKQSGR